VGMSAAARTSSRSDGTRRSTAMCAGSSVRPGRSRAGRRPSGRGSRRRPRWPTAGTWTWTKAASASRTTRARRGCPSSWARTRRCRAMGYEASQPSETPLVLELTITVHERTAVPTANASAAICIVDRNVPESTENAAAIDEPDADESVPADGTTAPPDNQSADAASLPDQRPTVPAQRGQRRHDTGPHQRTKNQRHEKRRPCGPSRTQDRYTDDRHDTDARTTPNHRDRHGAEPVSNRRAQPLESPQLNATTPVAASADKSSSEAAGSPEVFAATLPAGHSNQSSREPEECSAGSIPLTNHGQRIKKPVPSTPGDRL
jgi:hypothetical protein